MSDYMESKMQERYDALPEMEREAASMSEAKSLVVWKRWKLLSDYQMGEIACGLRGEYPMAYTYEYAFDDAGRFLGVFREVKT